MEVDITKNWLDRKAVCAALGIPEVWVFDGKKLVSWTLRQNGTCARRARSLALPGLLPGEVVKQLRAAAGQGETNWIRAFRRSLGAERAETP